MKAYEKENIELKLKELAISYDRADEMARYYKDINEHRYQFYNSRRTLLEGEIRGIKNVLAMLGYHVRLTTDLSYTIQSDFTFNK